MNSTRVHYQSAAVTKGSPTEGSLPAGSPTEVHHQSAVPTQVHHQVHHQDSQQQVHQ